MTVNYISLHIFTMHPTMHYIMNLIFQNFSALMYSKLCCLWLCKSHYALYNECHCTFICAYSIVHSLLTIVHSLLTIVHIPLCIVLQTSLMCLLVNCIVHKRRHFVAHLISLYTSFWICIELCRHCIVNLIDLIVFIGFVRASYYILCWVSLIVHFIGHFVVVTRYS